MKKGILLLLFLIILSAGSPGASAGVFVVTGDMGEEVTFDGPVSRIVSLYAGHTENIFAIGAGKALVAVSQADDRRITGKLPSLGIKPGVEQIVALKPDLVLARPMQVRAQSALFERLSSLGVRVLALDPPEWNEFISYIGLLGRLTGTADVSKRQATDAIRRVKLAVSSGGNRPRVLLITNGRTMATCTAESWASHIISGAGGLNAASGAKSISTGSVIASFGAERLLASDKNIDVILLQQGAMNSLNAKSFMGDPRFFGMRAVSSRRVFDVSEADISRPSLLRLQRGIVGDLRKLIAARGVLR